MFGVRCSVMVGMSAMVVSVYAGTAEQAGKIREEYRLQSEIVGLKLKGAKSVEEREAIWKERPSAVVFAKRMWQVMLPSLGDAWVVDDAGWFFEIAQQAQLEGDADAKVQLANACQTLRVALEKSHVKSPKLVAVCFSLIATNDSLALPLLEKIEKENPDAKVQGVAALGRAILLRSLGDSKDLLRQRLLLLRKAILNSADVEHQGVSVAKLAEDELYMIRFLTKGQQAPDLEGMDVDGKPLKLSAFSGKPVILIFWRGGAAGNEDLLNYVKGLREKYAAKGVVILGVNCDASEVLRDTVREKSIEWPNFADAAGTLANLYRVGVWPSAYVLDGERKICFSGQMGAFVDLTVDALLSDGHPSEKREVPAAPAKVAAPLQVKPPQ